MSARKPEVTVTTFHALDPRDCDCADDACVAAAIERTRVPRAASPGPARCHDTHEGAPAAAREGKA